MKLVLNVKVNHDPGRIRLKYQTFPRLDQFKEHVIALFTDNILHLHYNETECEAISGKNDKIARNCLVSTLHYIVMQMSN